MTTVVIVFASILAVFLGYTVVAPFALNFSRFLGRKKVACPHLDEEGEIELSPWGAALRAGYGDPRPDMTHCSLWGRRLYCDHKCLEGQPF